MRTLSNTNGNGTKGDLIVHAGSMHQNKIFLLMKFLYWDPGINT